jgi:hypothetical protein
VSVGRKTDDGRAAARRIAAARPLARSAVAPHDRDVFGIPPNDRINKEPKCKQDVCAAA